MRIKEGPSEYVIEQKRMEKKEVDPEQRKQRAIDNGSKPIEETKPYTNTQGQNTGRYVNTTA